MLSVAMRLKYFVVIVIVLISIPSSLWSQEGRVNCTLDESTHGSTIQIPQEGLQISCDENDYTEDIDWYLTITNSDRTCDAPYTLSLRFSRFNINLGDTLFIYDGPTTSSPLLVAANNGTNSLTGPSSIVYASRDNNNTTHSLTIRFKTAAEWEEMSGFYCVAECNKPCEQVVPHIDSVFERTRNGRVYATDVIQTSKGIKIITVCGGDGVRIHGYGEYSHRTGHYDPDDSTSLFTWTMDDKDNVVSGRGMDYVHYPLFDTLGCHNLILGMEDVNNCTSSMFDQVQIRTSVNPIKTISNLGTVCNNSELEVKVSYGENNAIKIDSIGISNRYSQTNNVKTFIPDGPECPTICYSAPVTFNEFPAGQTVTSGDDICSICINFEHSYMGDYDLRIKCPNGRYATLKYKDDVGDLPDGAYGGDGTYTGYPYGGDDDFYGDDDEFPCDSAYNMFGIGLDYCFSRNGNYTLVDGSLADSDIEGPHYLASGEYLDEVAVRFPPRPEAFRRDENDFDLEDTFYFTTAHPSNHAERKDYYKPADDFSSLIGCPLNGTWNIEICDDWASDNGWVFGWSMDLCSVSLGEDCDYNVKVDSISWEVTTESGVASVVRVRQDESDPMLFYMSAFDTAGRFYARMNVFDEFGCAWDSLGYFTVLWTPDPELGDNQVFCGKGGAMFDATDRHAQGGANYRYTYEWSTGETTPTITPVVDTTTMFRVVLSSESTNATDVSCVASDSVYIIIGQNPVAMFGQDSIGKLCSPYTMSFDNRSTNAESYIWDFGDGTSSTAERPIHTYVVGDYTVKLYVISAEGCRDTLIRADYIHVLPMGESIFKTMMCHGEEFTWVDGVTYTEPTTEPTMILTSSYGCDSLVHLHLGVEKNTEAKIHVSPVMPSYADTRVCLDDYGINSDSRTWWLPDGSISHNVSTCFDYPIEQDSVRVILAVESQYGCKDTTMTIVRLDRTQIWVPNTFTPDAPNNNRMAIACTDIDKIDASIFNRAGQQVYHFRDKSDTWDGKYNGTPCVQGVYVYLVRYTTIHNPERWQQVRGTVLLLR